MITYIAESVPAHELITDWPHCLDTPAGIALSARYALTSGPDEIAVRHELVLHLIHVTYKMDPAQQQVFYAASNAIAGGVDAVQISGRVYRIRQEGTP